MAARFGHEQPFARGQGKPFADGQPYLGGWIRVVPAHAAAANLALTHGLRVAPRAAIVLDVGTNAAIATPIPRGATAWTTTNIYLNWPLTTQPVTLLII